MNERLAATIDHHKSERLGLLAEAEQIELRWHLAAMVPRLRLTPNELQRAAEALQLYLDDRSPRPQTSQRAQALAEYSPQLCIAVT